MAEANDKNKCIVKAIIDADTLQYVAELCRNLDKLMLISSIIGFGIISLLWIPQQATPKPGITIIISVILLIIYSISLGFYTGLSYMFKIIDIPEFKKAA